MGKNSKLLSRDKPNNDKNKHTSTSVSKFVICPTTIMIGEKRCRKNLNERLRSFDE